MTYKPNFFILLYPKHPAFRIPPGTSPPFSSHRFLSHPLLRRGMGRPFFFGVYFLFLSISFLPVSPSTPFCILKDALLQCKRASFTTQKGTFYEPLCNLLIPWRLQSRLFILIVRFIIHMPLLFVRLFRNHMECMLYRRQAALLPYRTEAFADQSTTILQELLRSEKCVSKENIMLLILIFY